MRAVALVAVAESADVAPLQAGEVLIQLAVEVLPVALAQRYAETEAEHAAHSRVNAVVEKTEEILFGVVDERQDGRQPDHSGNARIPHHLEHFEAAPGRADIRLNHTAQSLVP